MNERTAVPTAPLHWFPEVRKHERSVEWTCQWRTPPTQEQGSLGGCLTAARGPPAWGLVGAPPTVLLAVGPGSTCCPHPIPPQGHTPAFSMCPREAPAIRVSVSLRIEVADVTGNTLGICSLNWLSLHADWGCNNLYLLTQNTSETQGLKPSLYSTQQWRSIQWKLKKSIIHFTP